MVITLLGDSLSSIKNQQHQQQQQQQQSIPFSLLQTLSISILMIKRINQLHEKGLIHRDVKPDNFLHGLGKKIEHLYLIDFGFTKRYMKSDNITHMVIKQNKEIIGTPRFTSINMHEGIEPSRRDDLESIGYIMIYLLNLDNDNDNDNDNNNSINSNYLDNYKMVLEKIKTFKMNIEKNDKIPKVIKQYLNYCRNLWFEAQPDYSYLIQLLQTEMVELNNNNNNKN